MTKRRKERKRVYNALSFQPAELNDNPGPRVYTRTGIASRKDKKRKGHRRGQIIHPQMKWTQIVEDALEPEEYWDDYSEKRDGFRDWSSDYTRYKRFYRNTPWHDEWNVLYKDINAKIERRERRRHNPKIYK